MRIANHFSCCGRLSLGFSILFAMSSSLKKTLSLLIDKEPFLDSSKNVFTKRKLVGDSSKNGNRERLDTECVLLHWVLPFTFPGALVSAKVS